MASKNPWFFQVYLGDSHELSTTGNLARFTCRERVESRREADVLVDFHAPILRRLRLWALDNAVPVAWMGKFYGKRWGNPMGKDVLNHVLFINMLADILYHVLSCCIR